MEKTGPVHERTYGGISLTSVREHTQASISPNQPEQSDPSSGEEDERK